MTVRIERQPPSRLSLIWPVAASLVLPLLAARFAYPGTHLPPKFGIFPPEFVQPPAPFNWAVFVALMLLAVGASAFLLFPQRFGFRPLPLPPPARRAPFPAWFWAGGALMLFFWWLMWTPDTPFGSLAHYAFTPLWWGFILVLDGLTYRRNDGRSLLSRNPRGLAIAAAVSVAGWCYFEYMNYFALSNWHYPNSRMPGLDHGAVIALFLVAYTTVWPVVLECYTLLNTFPGLRTRYGDGPRLAVPGRPLVWGGLLLTGLLVFMPSPLFWAVWVGPLCIMAGTLIHHGAWTPFTAMERGDWSPAILSAIASLAIGFFWEMWNHGSAHPGAALQTNPNFWGYEIPYVNVIHVFSEMPLLGYFGYLPFGLVVWLVYIWAGLLLDFDSRLDP